MYPATPSLPYNLFYSIYMYGNIPYVWNKKFTYTEFPEKHGCDGNVSLAWM